MRYKIGAAALVLSLSLGLAGFGLLAHAKAAAPQDSGFNLEVSPSPLIESIKPGQNTTVELHIRNRNTITEQLKIELKKFRVKNEKGEVQLSEESPTDVAGWVKPQQPNFNIKSGELYTEKISVDTPNSAGFSYYFAIVVSRQNPIKQPSNKTTVEGKVAVLTLFAVDKPGAKRQFEIEQFSANHRVYEYLPANLTLRVKNTGNTIVQPTGNIFIQRSSNSPKPITALDVNEKGSYILPGTTRDLSTSWEDGFPVFVAKKDAANTDAALHLEWSWGKANHFRIGKYTARLVAIYNDGQRDVPIQAEVSFWVIPWKLILIILFILAVIIIGFATLTRGAFRVARHTRGHKKSRGSAERHGHGDS